MDNLNDGYNSAEKEIHKALDELWLKLSKNNTSVFLSDEDISDLIFEECDNITKVCEPKYSLSITVVCWTILISFTIFLTYAFLHFH